MRFLILLLWCPAAWAGLITFEPENGYLSPYPTTWPPDEDAASWYEAGAEYYGVDFIDYGDLHQAYLDPRSRAGPSGYLTTGGIFSVDGIDLSTSFGNCADCGDGVSFLGYLNGDLVSRTSLAITQDVALTLNFDGTFTGIDRFEVSVGCWLYDGCGASIDNIRFTSVPEPGTLALLGGLLSTVLWRRSRRLRTA